MEIVAAGTDKFGDVVSLWNSTWPEFATDEEELRHRDSLDESMRSRCWLVYENDVPIALLEISYVSGSYHPQRWTINVAVSETFRNRGTGRNLYDFALQEIAHSNPLSILSYVREGDTASIRFAESRGFAESKRDFISELDLSTADMSTFEQLTHHTLPAGVRIVTGEEVDSLGFRHALHSLFEEVRKDIPRSFPPTPMTFEQFNTGFIDPHFDWRCSTFAMQGDEPVGFSTGFKGPTPDRMLQGLTAVAKKCRGQGLAKILKAHFALAAKRDGYEVIATDNDTRNAPMLAINNQFGFKRLPGTIHYLWSADGS
jgi:mycothiol synthase